MIRGSTTWSAERVETLTAMWRAGMSGNDIANRLGGVTRNAVIGKAHRLGLAGHQSKSAREDRKRQFSKSMHRTTRRKKAKPMKAETVQRLIFGDVSPLPVDDIPRGPLVMFADLEAHHCRAPYGDPKLPGFGFCGCKKVPGTSYCEDHHRRFFTAPRPRQPFVPGVPRQIHAVNSQVTPTEREDVFA